MSMKFTQLTTRWTVDDASVAQASIGAFTSNSTSYSECMIDDINTVSNKLPADTKDMFAAHHIYKFWD